jgi:signal transduction histidine kinase
MPELVNVVNLIEDSITNAAIQFREKGLTVHLNLDDRLPPLRADRDALNQIIGQLLTNAYLVSPPESEVYIRAERYAHAADKMLHLSVEDRGGGVDPADEARVFSRKYKAENPLIQGIGDTGVGLSIAKALVEAHGGKLWLESHPNVGNIFNVLLPLEPVLER